MFHFVLADAKAIRIRFYVVERHKACSDSYAILPPKKHADSLEDDANKVCLHDSRSVPVSAETVVLLAEYGWLAVCHLASV